MKRFLVILAAVSELAAANATHSAEIAGVPTAGGPGLGPTTVIFEPTEFPPPTPGLWIIALDFAAAEPIEVSFKTDGSPSDFVYSVSGNYTNSTGQALNELRVELVGGGGTVSLSDPVYDFSIPGSQINPRLLEFNSIALPDDATGNGSFNLNLGPDAINQDDFQLVFTPIPEPSTAMLLTVCAVAASLRRRRSLVC